jgi:heparan-alpha-glucosaminide N-acetyltransferase
MQVYNQLPDQRIYAVDIFRGLTILLMVFVNEVAGIRDIPQWLKHMPRGTDGMTIVDWVFPGFLFIVGMSIPLSINHRILKGDTFWQVQKHILVRTICLLILGVMMVNAEGQHKEGAMIIPIGVWSLLVYFFSILLWNVYSTANKSIVYTLRTAGIAGLIFLAVIYRGGPEGDEYISVKWWGILGIIGWSYLIASAAYQLCRGNKYYLGLIVVLCTLIFVTGKTTISEEYYFLDWTRSQTGRATHAAITICGVILTLIFFESADGRQYRRRVIEACVFVAILFVAGLLLRPSFFVAKLGATPSWGFFSSAISIGAFIFLYWLIDLKKISAWTGFLQPASSQPLLTYIIPFILWATYETFDFYPLPHEYRAGLPGVLFCVAYAFIIVLIARVLIRLNIRLQL